MLMWGLIGLLILVVLVGAASHENGPAEQTRRKAARRPPPLDPLMDEIERDPAGALARYGTPEDAAQLTAEGVDLEALGYRPPE